MQKKYRTKFRISVRQPKEAPVSEEKICRELNKINPKVFHEECLYVSNFNKLCFDRALVWDTHVPEMLKLSVLFPEVVFVLDGQGEDFGDFWRDYYKDGEVCHVTGKVVFETCKAAWLREENDEQES